MRLSVPLAFACLLSLANEGWAQESDLNATQMDLGVQAEDGEGIDDATLCGGSEAGEGVADDGSLDAVGKGESVVDPTLCGSSDSDGEVAGSGEPDGAGETILNVDCKRLFTIPVDVWNDELNYGLNLIYKVDACEMKGELTKDEGDEITQRFYQARAAEIDQTSCAEVKAKIDQGEIVRWFEETIAMSAACGLNEGQIAFIRNLVCPGAGGEINPGHQTCHDWLNNLARSSFESLTDADKEFIRSYEGNTEIDPSEALRKIRREENMAEEPPL